MSSNSDPISSSTATKIPIPLGGMRKRVGSAAPTITATSSLNQQPMGLMRRTTATTTTTGQNNIANSNSTDDFSKKPVMKNNSENTNGLASPVLSGRLKLQPLLSGSSSSSNTSPKLEGRMNDGNDSNIVIRKNTNKNLNKNQPPTNVKNLSHGILAEFNDDGIETIVFGSGSVAPSANTYNNYNYNDTVNYSNYNNNNSNHDDTDIFSQQQNESSSRFFPAPFSLDNSPTRSNNNKHQINSEAATIINQHGKKSAQSSDAFSSASPSGNQNNNNNPPPHPSNASPIPQSIIPIATTGGGKLNGRIRSASISNVLGRGGANGSNSSPRQILRSGGLNGSSSSGNEGNGGGGGGRIAGSAASQLRDMYDVDFNNVIGEGAFGTVCKGVCRETGEPVAVKNLNKQKVGARDLMTCLGEVETMTLLNHDSIVRLLDVFQDDAAMFIVMEFVGRGPLTEFVTKFGSLPESTVKRVTLNLLSALEHIHDKGIVHRDLKPANCLVSYIDYRPSENVANAVATRRARGWSLMSQPLQHHQQQQHGQQGQHQQRNSSNPNNHNNKIPNSGGGAPRTSSIASSFGGHYNAAHQPNTLHNGSFGGFSSPSPTPSAGGGNNNNNNSGNLIMNNTNQAAAGASGGPSASPKSGLVSPTNSAYGSGGAVAMMASRQVHLTGALNKSDASVDTPKEGSTTPRDLNSTQQNVFSGFNGNSNNNNNNGLSSSAPKKLIPVSLGSHREDSFDMGRGGATGVGGGAGGGSSSHYTNTNQSSPSSIHNNHLQSNTSNPGFVPPPEEQRGDPILGVKICDFGFAVMVGGGACLTNFCGTPSYMAPDITLAEATRTPYGKPVDMWALGVMVYWLACCKMPFSKTQLAECTPASLAPSFAEPEWQNFSECGKDFIKRLLCFDASRRVTAKAALADRWITSSTELSEVDSKREALIDRLAEKADVEGEDAALRELQVIEDAKKKKMSKRKIHTMRAAAAVVVAAHRLIFFSSVRRLVRHGCSTELISAVNRGLMSFLLGGDYDPPSHAIRARRLLRRHMTPPPHQRNASHQQGKNQHRTLSPPVQNSNFSLHGAHSTSSTAMATTSASSSSPTTNELSTHACDFVCTLLENAPRVTHFDVADNGIESLESVQRIVRAAQGHRALVELSLAENPLHPLAGRTLLRFARNAASPALAKIDVHGCSNLTSDIGPSVATAIKERIEQLRASAGSSNNERNTNGSDFKMLGDGNVSPSTAYLHQVAGKDVNNNNNASNDFSSSIRIRRRQNSAGPTRLMSTGGNNNNTNNNNNNFSQQQPQQYQSSSNGGFSEDNKMFVGQNNTPSSSSPSTNMNKKVEWSLEYSIMRHLRAANPSRGIFAETISSANRRSASSGGVLSFSSNYQLPPLRASTPSIPSSSTPVQLQHQQQLPPRSNSTVPPSSSTTTASGTLGGMPLRTSNLAPMMSATSSNNNNHNANNSSPPPTGSPSTRNLVGMQHNHNNNALLGSRKK